ncbi:hypothetical protein fugu_009651 [Takifugu bimaculatus]|uniref:Protein OSCP1 n=2 Tax=Takifugu TaxID=31032 RepID=A0A4Z2CDD5_9TELE|nr:hypothetical protein fugu_009651 [Takifugu bimaculatus]
MASYWITAAGAIIFQLETSYLTPTDEMSRFAFRQQSRKTHPVVVEMTLVCLRTQLNRGVSRTNLLSCKLAVFLTQTLKSSQAAEVHTQLRMSTMSNPVITHQPGSGGYGTNVQTGEWSTGLCSCCTDFFVCAIGCFCPMILSCYTANKYGENCCLGCLPGGMTAVRTHMRLTYGIQGTIINDALMTFFCGICETCRMAREFFIGPSATMSSRTLPLLFINLGGEMLYILDQRLRAQNIPADKAKKVMNDIITTMFNKKFLEELFKPQELYSKKALRTVFDRLAHASIMRLNQASMDKLYDLMTMAFKYQVLLCPRPKDILLVSFNHMDAIRDFVKDTPAILNQVDETYQQLIEMYAPMTSGDFQLIRQTLLIFFQDMHIRVSIFLKDKVQNSNGRFVLPTSGPVPFGTQVPGTIRLFSCSGEEVSRLQFSNGGNYSVALREGSFEIFGDRVTKLGTNMYSVSRPVETHMSGTTKTSAQHTKVNTAPNPLAKEELNLLARLMGGLEVQKLGNADTDFRLNLFANDKEEEEALLLRPDELSYGVIKIQATKDQQASAELAKIMGEFTESGDQPASACSKGDDLLAMMDGL